MVLGLLYKKGISYRERPVTIEERQVAQIFEKFYSVREIKDITEVFRLFSKDATIFTRSKRRLTIWQYCSYLKENFENLVLSSFYDVSIRIRSDNTAVISAVAYYRYTTQEIGPGRIIFELSKTEDSWRIYQVEWI